jgi:hypothetical protein
VIRTRRLAEVNGEGLVWGGIGFVASLVVGVALSPFRGSIGCAHPHPARSRPGSSP